MNEKRVYEALRDYVSDLPNNRSFAPFEGIEKKPVTVTFSMSSAGTIRVTKHHCRKPKAEPIITDVAMESTFNMSGDSNYEPPESPTAEKREKTPTRRKKKTKGSLTP